jgi:hypothetical protein
MKIKLISIIAGFTAISQAGVLSTQTEVDSFNSNLTPGSTICFSTTSNCAGDYSFAGSDLSYSATALADYGVLKASGSLSIARPDGAPGSGGPSEIDAQGFASFEDIWTIGGAPDGTTGHLTLQFAVSGTYGSSGVDTGYGYGLNLRTFTPFHDSTDSELPPYTGTLTADFTFGSPLDFQVSLSAGSSLENLESGGTDGQFSFLDESHTAILSVVGVTDQNGDVVPFTLQTASNSPNFAQFGSVSAAPEPGTFRLLAGTGGLFIVLKRRGFRTRRG